MANFMMRQATVDDARSVAELCSHVHEIHHAARPDFFKPFTLSDEMIGFFTARLADEGYFVNIGEVDGETVGYVLAQVVNSPENIFAYASQVVVIDQMGVNPKYRSQGYGELLLKSAFEWACERGITRVLLTVWAFNERANQFYERLGFKARHTRMEIMLGD